MSHRMLQHAEVVFPCDLVFAIVPTAEYLQPKKYKRSYSFISDLIKEFL